MPHDSGNYAIGWFTLSLINSGLAQGKGRSGLNWFVVSLLLGPVATFLIVGDSFGGVAVAAVNGWGPAPADRSHGREP